MNEIVFLDYSSVKQPLKRMNNKAGRSHIGKRAFPL